MYEISNVYKKMQILCKRVDFSEASYSWISNFSSHTSSLIYIEEFISSSNRHWSIEEKQ